MPDHSLAGLAPDTALEPPLWVPLAELPPAQAAVRQTETRTITVRSHREDENLVVEITDSWPGIAPEHLPHIFNPFCTTKPRGSGTGLGLSIADGIVKAHGGSLRVQSDLGRGARFEMVIPLVLPPALPS